MYACVRALRARWNFDSFFLFIYIERILQRCHDERDKFISRHVSVDQFREQLCWPIFTRRHIRVTAHFLHLTFKMRKQILTIRLARLFTVAVEIVADYLTMTNGARIILLTLIFLAGLNRLIIRPECMGPIKILKNNLPLRCGSYKPF